MKTRSSPYAILLLIVPLVVILGLCLWRLRPAHGAEAGPKPSAQGIERPPPPPPIEAIDARPRPSRPALLTEIHPQEGCQVQVRDHGAALMVVCDEPGWTWLRLDRAIWHRPEQTIASESPLGWWSRHSGAIGWALALWAGVYLGRRWGRRARPDLVAEPAGLAELRREVEGCCEEIEAGRAALRAERTERAQAEEALETQRQEHTDFVLRHIHRVANLEREIAGLQRELAERQVVDHTQPVGYLGQGEGVGGC